MMKNVLTILLLFAFFASYAQEAVTIRGIVTEAQTGEPLIGLAIQIQGTDKGFVTDYNGRFSYQLRGENIAETVLVVSYIGMVKQ